MSIFKKIVTAIRGGASEAGEAIVDLNAIRIFEQELRDSNKEIDNATTELTSLMATKSVTDTELAGLQQKFNQYETQAISELEAGNEALATKIAERMDELESDIEEKKNLQAGMAEQVDSLKTAVKNNKKKVEKAGRQISTIKAQESINKATENLAAGSVGTSSKLNQMDSSLDRITKRQAHKKAQNKAAQTLSDETSGKSLDDEIAASSSSGKLSMLEKLKQKQASK
jgi:phage shock protein A